MHDPAQAVNSVAKAAHPVAGRCVLALVVKQELERLTELSFREAAALVQRVSAAKMKDGSREFWMRGEWPASALPMLQKLGVRLGPRTWAVGSGSNPLEASEGI